MIIVLKPEATPADLDHLTETLKAKGLSVNISRGKERTVVGAIGD